MSAAKTVTVGTATAAPGTAVRGAIPVTTLAGGTPLEIPVVVVNGARPGPCFWVDGAIHGDEPEGPLACQIALRRGRPGAARRHAGAVPRAERAGVRGGPARQSARHVQLRHEPHLSGTRQRLSHRASWRPRMPRRWRPVADFEISIHSGGAHSFLDKAIFVDERPEVGGTGHGDGARLGLHHVVVQSQGQPDGPHEGPRQGGHHRGTRRTLGDLADRVRPGRTRAGRIRS